MSDHGQDKGPLYREYLGGDLDDTMECPLSSPRYSETQFGADCSYTIYTINNASMKWVDMYAQPGYERLYTAWQPDNNPNLSFTVIVSDSALTHTSGLPYATHPGPKGSLGEVGNSGNREQFGWLLSPTDTAPINYADADGSVRSYDFDVNSRFSSAWVQVPGNMPHFVPREMAK
ncbi:MAG: hypothetical protein GC164_03830 [Phycisphaera sp.]|nr:hypothetical protein [Phycisphaera sp.]